MHRTLWSALAAVILVGCAPRTLTPDAYAERLPALEARVAARPGDTDALRDLGEALAYTRDFARARDVLAQAEAAAPGNAKTLYLLGVAEEGTGDRRAALSRYARYAEVPLTSPYRQYLSRRHAWLLRRVVRDELAALLAAEDSVTAEGVTEAVAVFPLAFRGGDSLYAPLGRGLAEMLTVDLASVERIRVVERVRLQALLDELEMSSGAAFDAATAPRLGRLLRSGRVVGGAFAADARDLRTDVATWAWPDEPLPDLRSRAGALADLFRLQKEIAFGVVDDLGVELTAAERERIERVPTRNLQAFLAYSRGLLEEDAGRFAEAAALYAEAVRLDPAFAEAARKRREAEELAEADLDVDGALSEIAALAAPPPFDLVGTRLALLNGSIGATIVPGEEARDPSGEVPVTPPDGPGPGEPGGDPLPEPPGAPSSDPLPRPPTPPGGN